MRSEAMAAEVKHSTLAEGQQAEKKILNYWTTRIPSLPKRKRAEAERVMNETFDYVPSRLNKPRKTYPEKGSLQDLRETIQSLVGANVGLVRENNELKKEVAMLRALCGTEGEAIDLSEEKISWFERIKAAIWQFRYNLRADRKRLDYSEVYAELIRERNDLPAVKPTKQ